MGDRVGPVGTGETSSFVAPPGGAQRLTPVNWSAILGRQEALVSTKVLINPSLLVYSGTMSAIEGYFVIFLCYKHCGSDKGWLCQT